MTISCLLLASKIVISSNEMKIHLMNFWAYTCTDIRNIKTFGMSVRLYSCCPMGKVPLREDLV